MFKHGKTISILSLLFLLSCAEDVNKSLNSNSENELDKGKVIQTPKVIYGNDDRKDIYQVFNQQLLELADSTVALIDSDKLNQVGGGFSEVKARKFGDSYSLCSSEPFREQPAGAFCSGFLVGEDLIVTAGHCVRNQKACEGTKFVFSYALKSTSDTAEVVDSQDVYGCKELVHSEVKGNGADFAVVRLDKKVSNHSPLNIRRAGQISVNQDITVIGHPAGIPTKIAGGAQVRSQGSGFFNTNLDTYGGNSGSAVFNSDNGEVEGILVRGATDFVFKNGCRVSNVCKSNECRGEDVTRIAEALEYIPELVIEEVPVVLVKKVYKNNQSQSIPDNDSRGIHSYVVADEAPLGREIQVEVDISHSWRGDLKVYLTSPDGQVVQLHNRAGRWRNDLKGVYGVNLSPSAELSPLSDDEQDAWRLSVSDHARQDKGVLHSWSLRFIPKD